MNFIQYAKLLLPYLLLYLPIIVFVIMLVYNSRMPHVRNMILSLVIEAEKNFGKGNGNVKYSYVVGKIYPLLPLVVRLFITESMLGVVIEECVLILKEQLKFTEQSKITSGEQVAIQEQVDNDMEMSTK